MTQIIIWSETAYRNGICYNCETRVRDADGNPLGELKYDMRTGYLFCPHCFKPVGKIKRDKRSAEELKDMKMKKKGEWEEEL